MIVVSDFPSVRRALCGLVWFGSGVVWAAR